MKLRIYSDDGHGWLACKRSLLEEYGIASRITVYSYQKGDMAYLEEDLDACTLVDALAKNGIVPEFERRIHDGRSPIRYYERFRA